MPSCRNGREMHEITGSSEQRWRFLSWANDVASAQSSSMIIAAKCAHRGRNNIAPQKDVQTTADSLVLRYGHLAAEFAFIKSAGAKIRREGSCDVPHQPRGTLHERERARARPARHV